MYGKPVAWVNVAGPAAPNRGADANDSLRKVLRYTGSEIVEAACRDVPVTRDRIGDDGLFADAAIREQIAAVLTVLGAGAQDAR